MKASTQHATRSLALRLLLGSIVTLSAAVSAVACKPMNRGAKNPATEERAAKWQFTGDDCKGGSGVGPTANESDEARAKVLLCADSPRFSGEIATDLQARHARLDDRKPDALTTDVLLLSCARWCDPKKDRLAIAVLSTLGKSIDEDGTRKALDKLGWSDDAKDFFIERVKDADELLSTRAAKLDKHRKALTFELATALHADRARYYQTHAKLYAAYDALRPEIGKARKEKEWNTELVDKLVELRATYLEACGAPECRFDPFPVEITRKVVLLDAAAGDDLGAALESSLFREPAPMRNAWGPSFHRAQWLAIRREEEAYASVAAAKDDGADEDTLQEKFGENRPVHVTVSSSFAASAEAPAVLRDASKLEPVTAVVATVKIKGELAEITFDETISRYEPSDCQDSDRLEALVDGKPRYRKTCRATATKPASEAIAPIRVPKVEAQFIKPKEELTFVVRSDRVGGVAFVRDKGGNLVQFRMHRLRPEVAHPVISDLVELDRTKKKS